MIHPARTILFRDLYDGLREAKEKHYVNECLGPDGLALYSYTQSCSYDGAWDAITVLARGLVLDHKNQRVAATPFPKFFNAFEREQSIPDMPFEAFEKIDGSLIILFWRDGWYATTKGSFTSVQAKQAKNLLGPLDLLRRENTYLLEYVGPDNRIVIGYPEPRLYLLSAYTGDGIEFDYDTQSLVAEFMGWEIAPRRHFDSFADILVHTKGLPATQEGHVVRFNDGLRLKIKGDEYCRIHSLISGATPLGIWDLMRHGQDLTEIRKQLPEEFWYDFDNIKNLLQGRVDAILDRVKQEAAGAAGLTDKEVGLRLNQFPEDVRKFIFPYRKAAGDHTSPRFRESLFRDIRPDANHLDGYVPSYAMNRVVEES